MSRRAYADPTGDTAAGNIDRARRPKRPALDRYKPREVHTLVAEAVIDAMTKAPGVSAPRAKFPTE